MVEGNRRPPAFSMKACLVMAVLLAIGQPAMAGEAWQPVYEDGLISVAIDAASLSREKQSVVFREREIMLRAAMDPATMRKIQETQYRRQADCAGRRISLLSRAVFSEQGSLIHYEANRPAAANWEMPKTGRELKLLEAVCGTA